MTLESLGESVVSGALRSFVSAPPRPGTPKSLMMKTGGQKSPHKSALPRGLIEAC
jgi:hypothetical protein